MNQWHHHYIRWLAMLHTASTNLAHAVLNPKHDRAAFNDVADQLETIARNIRERAGSKASTLETAHG